MTVTVEIRLVDETGRELAKGRPGQAFTEGGTYAVAGGRYRVRKIDPFDDDQHAVTVRLARVARAARVPGAARLTRTKRKRSS